MPEQSPCRKQRRLYLSAPSSDTRPLNFRLVTLDWDQAEPLFPMPVSLEDTASRECRRCRGWKRQAKLDRDRWISDRRRYFPDSALAGGIQWPRWTNPRHSQVGVQ